MTNTKEAMAYSPQGINKVSTCVVIDNDYKLKKHYLEAEKGLKKMEQDYLHTSQKYTETESQWQDLREERSSAISRFYSTANFIDWCKGLVEQLQKVLAKLPKGETTEEAIDHSLQFSMFNSGESSAQENTMIFQQKAQFQKLDSEVIRDFREFSRNLYYILREMPSDSRKAAHDLRKELKEKNKSKDKALSNCMAVCNPKSHDSLRKSVELEIEVLKKLIRELQKDWEERMHMQQCARNIYRDFKQKVKHLEKKKEHLSGQWDEERKYMLRTKRKT